MTPCIEGQMVWLSVCRYLSLCVSVCFSYPNVCKILVPALCFPSASTCRRISTHKTRGGVRPATRCAQRHGSPHRHRAPEVVDERVLRRGETRGCAGGRRAHERRRRRQIKEKGVGVALQQKRKRRTSAEQQHRDECSPPLYAQTRGKDACAWACCSLLLRTRWAGGFGSSCWHRCMLGEHGLPAMSHEDTSMKDKAGGSVVGCGQVNKTWTHTHT